MNIAIKTFAIFLLFVLVNITSQAATITVDTLEDVIDNTNGDCSLREAITAANNEAPEDNCVAGSGADEIVFAGGLTGSIALQSAFPFLSSDITITGPGRTQLTISGENNYRIFWISGGTVSISGITVANGYSGDLQQAGGIFVGEPAELSLRNCRVMDNVADGTGGGIYVIGTLSVDNCIVSNNESYNGGSGGGISVFLGTLSVTNSIISNNNTDQSGGGIVIRNVAAPTQILNSEISGNHSVHTGGGIWNDGSGLLIQNSLITGNITDGNAGGGGGGLFNSNFLQEDSHIEFSVISNNASLSGIGGGIRHNSGTLFIEYSTIHDNSNAGISASQPVQISNSTVSGNDGNGVYITSNIQTEIRNSTIASNTGYGIFHDGELSLYATIVANNTNVSCFVFGSGSIMSLGWNIDSDNTCQLTQPIDHPGVDPLLGPLQDNDGYSAGAPGNRQVVPTHALLAFSPAIDTGDNATCPAQDQRGGLRPVDGDGDGTATCDIGAVEQVYEAHIVVTDGITPAEDRDMPFGDVMVGDVQQYIITLTNQGMQNLVIDGLALSSRVFGFDLNAGASPCGALDIILGPSEVCTVGISFNPAATGEQTGRIVITSNDPDEPVVVITMSGRGINPDLVADPDRQNFGLFNVGDTGTQTITLSNIGVGLLRISAMSVTGSDASHFSIIRSGSNPCPAIPFMVINEGASCTIDLVYTPTSPGNHIAQLELVSNDPDGSPQVIAVTGEGNSLPQFTGGTGSFDIAEDVSNGTLVTTLQAVDVDGDVPVYSIVSGNQDSHFAIDSGSGEITVAASLDFETISSYQLGVRIDDGRGGTTTADVIVNITDVDETQQNTSPGSGGGGCTVSSDAPFDPLFPVLLLSAWLYLFRQRKMNYLVR